MGYFGKLIGGGLGFVLHGPIGAIIGFFVGSMFDNIQVSTGTTVKTATPGDYVISLLVLIAAILKADGKILRSELDYVKKFLIQNFGQEGAREALIMLKDILKQNIPVQEVCEQINSNVNYSQRLQLLHFLYDLANTDKQFEVNEERILEQIAIGLRITPADRQSMKSMFKNTLEDYYKILEIEEGVTDEELKKAYRKMAMKYHPDKVATMGEDVKRAAHEKFQKLNEAYEKIKKARNLV